MEMKKWPIVGSGVLVACGAVLTVWFFMILDSESLPACLSVYGNR
jgi:hypothetical protein